MINLLPNFPETQELLDRLNNESDMGRVLITASMCDENLKYIISSFLIEGKDSKALLEGFNAPLGTFASRITVAYSLGLVSKKEFQTLNMIRKIRNVFAHNITADFESEKVRGLCSKLGWKRRVEKNALEEAQEARLHYSLSALGLALSLYNRPKEIVKLRRVERSPEVSWPNVS